MSGDGSARRVAPEVPGRRGWCPGLARPMPTGDGLLARVHPPLGVLDAAQARAVAEGARRHGNGHVDITARANLQVRGVTEVTHRTLADDLAVAGLADMRADGGPQRLTLALPAFLTHPAAGPGPSFEPAPLARAVEAAGLACAGLPAKTLVALDAGGVCGLAGIEADFHLRGSGPGQVAIGFGLGSTIAWHALIPLAEAAERTACALGAFAARGARRMRDLGTAARAGVAAAAGLVSAPEGPAAAPLPAPGPYLLEDGRVALVAEAPFGRCTAARLAGAADLAGGSGLHLLPTRGLALVCPVDAARAVEAALRALGFILAADDPRRAVAACPGAPACASGSTPVPAEAARLAAAFAPHAALGRTAHISGCAKGCAHPGAADLTLVASGGLYDVVVAGAPRDAPRATRLTFEAALERVRRAPPTLPLEQAFQDAPR